MNAITQIGPSREQLCTLQNALEQHGLQGDELEAHFPLKHHFAPGTYGREILLPADSLVVGKIHIHGHLNIISRGLVSVATEFGVVTYDARERPATFASLPGTKRAVFAHEDTIWTTIHLTEETDLGKIEAQIIAPSFDDARLALNQQLRLLDSEAA
jgi:hypothetical protein